MEENADKKSDLDLFENIQYLWSFETVIGKLGKLALIKKLLSKPEFPIPDDCRLERSDKMIWNFLGTLIMWIGIAFVVIVFFI